LIPALVAETAALVESRPDVAGERRALATDRGSSVNLAIMSRPAESYQVNFPPPSDDGQRLPDLQGWIKFYGGYHNIPLTAWARWDRLYETYREHRRINLGSPITKA
jgi:hypothetical protein